MELLETIGKMTLIAGYLIVGLLNFIFFVAMGNHMPRRGKSFRLLFPFVILDSTEFDEKGLVYRRYYLYTVGAAIGLFAVYWMFVGPD